VQLPKRPYLAVLNGYEKMHVVSIIEVLGSVLWAGLILLAVYLNLDVTGLVTLLLISPVLMFIMNKWASDRYCCVPVYVYEMALVKKLLIATLPFAFMVI